MFKIEKGKNKYLSAIANEFYSKVNPVKRNGLLNKYSLKKRLLKKIRSEKDPRKKIFYIRLAEKKFKLLKEIIVGTPSQLAAIQKRFDAMVLAGIIPTFSQSKAGVLSCTSFGAELLKLFDYKACRGSLKFIWLVDELNVFICPYCNVSQTHKVKTADDIKILFEFDHFIPQVIAPYLSLSFFNLIPSCHVCNSSLKGATVFSLKDYTHPYDDDLNSWIRFSTDNPVDISDDNSFEVVIKTITANVDEITKSNNNVRVFQIQSRYNHFKEDIIRLEKLKPNFSESKKKEMLNHGFMGALFSNRADLNSHIAFALDLPVNEFQALRREKGKFKLDIAKEFEILD